MNFINSVKKTIIKTYLFEYITARVHQRKRRKELYALSKDLIVKYQKRSAESNCEIANYIWVCWWQGIENMPTIVAECYERIKLFNPDKKVVLLTENNLDNYVLFPDYILSKYRSGRISKTHLSDILRVELLKKYGGIWIDATLFTTGPVPSQVYEFAVFSGRYKYDRHDLNVSKNRWTTYFWVSRKRENILFNFLSDFWKKYWYLYDTSMEYFLLDYAIELGYHYIPAIRHEIDNIPIDGCGENPWYLLRHLNDQYDEDCMSALIKANWMQKLSYKVKKQDNCNSYYNVLFGGDLDETK